MVRVNKQAGGEGVRVGIIEGKPGAVGDIPLTFGV
jgi:hypothetical protein